MVLAVVAWLLVFGYAGRLHRAAHERSRMDFVRVTRVPNTALPDATALAGPHVVCTGEIISRDAPYITIQCDGSGLLSIIPSAIEGMLVIEYFPSRAALDAAERTRARAASASPQQADVTET
jgi:hypothetical protein